MSFFDTSFTSPTKDDRDHSLSFFEVPSTPMVNPDSFFENDTPFSPSDFNLSTELFKTPLPPSPLTKKKRETPKKVSPRKPSPKKQSKCGDVKPGVFSSSSNGRSFSSSSKMSPGSCSSLSSSDLTMSMVESPQPKRVRKVEDSPAPADVKKDLLTARKTPTPAPAVIEDDFNPPITSPPPSGTLEDVIGQLMKDQQVELMASLRSLSAHHEKGAELVAKTDEILQDLNEYRRKLAYDKERYQSLSFLCFVTDYMILRFIAATNHFGLILPDKKMTEKDVKK